MRVIVLAVAGFAVAAACLGVARHAYGQDATPVEIDRFWQPVKSPVARGAVKTSHDGVATYVIPLELPPARLTPSLALHYSSSSPFSDRELGLGWSLGLPSITIDTGQGPPAFGPSDNYVTDRGRLVESGSCGLHCTTYRAEDDTGGNRALYKFDRSVDEWKLTDKSGTRWVFASTVGGSGGTFQWRPLSMEDAHGNEVDFTYDPNGILETITYGGNSSTADAAEFEVWFTTSGRVCTASNYRSGVRDEHAGRITTIEVIRHGVSVAGWDLVYDDCPTTLREVEAWSYGTVRSAGVDRRVVAEMEYYESWGFGGFTALPSAPSRTGKTFGMSYTLLSGTDGGDDFDTGVPDGAYPTITLSETNATVLNGRANRDPIPDFWDGTRQTDGGSVAYPWTPSTNHHYVGLSAPHASGLPALNQTVSYAPPILGASTTELNTSQVVDWDGDGFDDVIEAPVTISGTGYWTVHLSDASGLGAAGSVTFPGPMNTAAVSANFLVPLSATVADVDMQVSALVDVNADGFLDAVAASSSTTIDIRLFDPAAGTYAAATTSMAPWCAAGRHPEAAGDCFIRLAVGNGNKTVHGPLGTITAGRVQERVGLYDINGDGLTDVVESIPGMAGWVVYPGTGTGFATPLGWGSASPPLAEHVAERPIAMLGAASTATFYQTVQLLDVNGDGLPDLVDWQAGTWQRNLGDGFGSPASLPGAPAVGLAGQAHVGTGWYDPFNHRISAPVGTEIYLQSGDWNGDGIGDVLDADGGRFWQLDGGLPLGFQLKTVRTPARDVDIAYRPSSAVWPSGDWSPGIYHSILTALPDPSPHEGWAVHSVETTDGPSGAMWWTQFDWANASWDPASRSFEGYEYQWTLDSDDRWTATIYEVTLPGNGQPLETHVGEGSASGGVWLPVDPQVSTYSDYRQTEPDGAGKGWVSVLENESIEQWGTGAASTLVRKKSVDYTYDSEANVTTLRNNGELTSADDDTVVSVQWAAPGTFGLRVPCAIQVDGFDPRGGANATFKKQQFLYDGASSLCSVTDGLLTTHRELLIHDTTTVKWLETTHTYTAEGLLETLVSPEGAVTSFRYDADKVHREEEENHLGHITLRNFDDWGNVLFEEQPFGRIDLYEYDGFRRPVLHEVTDGSGATDLVAIWLQRLDGPYPFKAEIGIRGTVFEYYNSFGDVLQRRTSSLTFGTWSVQDFEFDPYGQTVRASVPYFDTSGAHRTPWSAPHWTATSYDLLGQVEDTTDAFGGTTGEVPFLAGRPWERHTVDQAGFEDHQILDSYGRIVRAFAGRWGESLSEAEYLWDPMGRLVRAVDPDGIRTDLFWASTGKLLKVESVDLGQFDITSGSMDVGYRAYEYNDDGQLVKRTDSAGREVNYELDMLGRTTGVWDGPLWTGTKIETHTWDVAVDGLLDSVEDAGGVVTYSYNARGVNTGETRTYNDGSTASVSVVPDAIGRTLRTTYPDGTEVQITFNGSLIERVDATLMTGVVHNLGTMTYAPDGTPTGWTSTYDVGGASLTGLEATVLRRNDLSVDTIEYALGTTTRAIDYGYLGNGLIHAKTLDGSWAVGRHTTTFTYDAAKRLKASSSPFGAHTQSWEVSDGGDLLVTEQGLFGSIVSWSLNRHPGSHQLKDYTDGATTWSYRHDASGIVDQITEVSGTFTSVASLQHDAFGRPVAYIDGGTIAWTKVHAHDGHVVEETIDGVHAKRLREWERIGTDSRVTISLGHLVLGRVVNGTSLDIVMSDMQGTPITVTDAIGTVKHDVETTAFGLEARAAGGPVDNFRWHTGQPRSASLGLVGMPHRWMNPLTTEFLSPDPAFSDERAVDALLQPHRMHPFRYAHGDPLTYMDRSGEWVESAIDVASLGVGIYDIAANGPNVWNVTGVVVDAVALAVPFVPGGASLAIKGGRAAYTAYIGAKAANLAQNSVTAGRAVGTAARQADAGKAVVAAEGSRGVANLDTGSAVAFVSEGSPVRGALKAAVGDRTMVMTQTALGEFRGALRAAGATEAARAERLLGRVTIVADNPSARAAGLRVTKSVGANDIVIFGTGDSLGATTLTSDAKFLRGASAQGVDFDAFLHQPVPLTGQ